MVSSLSNLVNNLSERFHRIKCKLEHDDKKCETCGIKYKYCNCFLEYTNFQDDLIEDKCLSCNKKHQRKLDEKLKKKKKFLTMITINLFYCCEKVFILMNMQMIGKNSRERHYLKNKDFYSHFNVEDITHAGYEHSKRV